MDAARLPAGTPAFPVKYGHHTLATTGCLPPPNMVIGSPSCFLGNNRYRIRINTIVRIDRFYTEK